MDPARIRRRVVKALFSDRALQNLLVLKGGNALELVHGLAARGSIDLDFSVPEELADPDGTGERIRKALEREFRKSKVRVFDFQFKPVPKLEGPDEAPWWGGYSATFKLIEEDEAARLGNEPAAMQREALTIDPRQRRVFSVDISKCEYCDGKTSATFDGETIYVYTEEMCVVEKFRALCQQLPEYERTNPTPRAKDFFDIYSAVTGRGIDLALPENLELFRQVFAAKRVPLSLLSRLEGTREFHRVSWDSVRQEAPGNLFEFDIYFDFTLAEAAKLHTLWDE